MADIQKYPARRYHATEPSRVVQNEEEEKALGKGWYDSPKKATKSDEKKPAEKATKSDEK